MQYKMSALRAIFRIGMPEEGARCRFELSKLAVIDGVPRKVKTLEGTLDGDPNVNATHVQLKDVQGYGMPKGKKKNKPIEAYGELNLPLGMVKIGYPV